jgi:hypothetical protein
MSKRISKKRNTNQKTVTRRKKRASVTGLNQEVEDELTHCGARQIRFPSGNPSSSSFRRAPG